MELIQDNTVTTIHFTEDQSVRDKVEEFLYDNLAADVPGAQFSPQVKRGFWDGKTHFYDKTTHTFASGLLNDVTELLEKVRFTYEFTFSTIDNRPDRFVNSEDLPDEISLGGLTLRDYQMQAVRAVFESGMGGIINVATGGGKSAIMAAAIQQVLPKLQKGERVIVFTNNKEIFRQNTDNLKKFIDEPVGYLGGGKKKMARVMVVMIPTADSYLKIDPEAGLSFSPKEQQIKKMAKTYAPKFVNEEHPFQAFKSFVNLYRPVKKVDYTTQETLEDILDTTGSDKELLKAFNKYNDQYKALVAKKSGDKVKKKQFIIDFLDSAVMFVSDECQHSKADTWYRVMLACNNAIYRVGLSGSIDTEDPVLTYRLRGVFSKIVAKVRTKQLVDKQLLAKPTIVMIPITEPASLAAVSTKGNGWQKIYKLGIEENEYRNTLISGIAKKQYDNGKTVLVIVNRINQADIISAYLDALNVPHEFINGQQDDEERKAELSRVASGETRVLLSTSVLDEGVDISNIDTLVMAAGGKSMRQVIQRIGRVLRKKKDKENKATIFDFEDNENQALRKHTKERLAIYKEQEFDVKYVGR